jgi:NHL repeat
VKTIMIAVIAALLAGNLVYAGQAEFSAKPQVVSKDKKVTITFAVKEPIDAAVEIVDSKGVIIRRLGAAALGAKNPPPPPFQTGLSQSIIWDGRDQTGKTVSGKDLRVRVRLGMKVAFDRFIGWQGVPPMANVLVNGMAVTPDRKVYVMGISRDEPRSGRCENRVWVMSKEGQYLKTIYPFPATADPATLRGVDFLSSKKNRLIPRIYDRVVISSMPQMRAVTRQTMAATADGQLVFISGWATELYSFGPRSIMIMKTDGSIPRKRIDGPTFDKIVKGGYSHLALAPDQKSVYVCGMATKRYGKPENVVYRVGLQTSDEPKIIFGSHGKAASGKDGLNEPRGIAVDGKGRVYISDFGNNRIAILKPDGAYAGQIDLKGPGVLAAHPKSNAIYAISMPEPKKVYKLVKISGGDKPQIVAEVDLSKYGGITSAKTHVGYHPVITIDPFGPKPIIYVASPAIYCRARIIRITDQGTALQDEAVVIPAKGDIKGYPYPIGTNIKGDFYFRSLSGSLGIDRCFSVKKYEAATGKIVPAHRTLTGVVGKDGLFYHGSYQGKSVRRKDQSGKVVPFSATGEWSEPYSAWRFYDRRSSWHVFPSGDIWALAGFEKVKPFGASVVNLGKDGQIKRKDIITGFQGPTSLRVDSNGNIFVADGFNRYGKPYPPEIDKFAKRLRAKGTSKRGIHSEAVEDSYGEAYGSIFKFSAKEGGSIRKVGNDYQTQGDEIIISPYPQKAKFVVSGAKGIYPRISPLAPPRYISGGVSSCWCLFAIFDLDMHNRLFVPDAMQQCVRVVDANFNEILKFGEYDSATSKGGKANLPGPEIPFEFPTYVHVSDDAAYVTDTASCARRVVRVKLSYRVEESCKIK